MQSLRIMIVDDDVMLSAILAELLTAMGHAVCATEATEAGAVAAAARLAPDLILVDVHLGRGDGVAAMAAIARARPVAHIYVTGGSPAAEGRPDGAAVLQKPFSEALLAQAIARAVAPAAPDRPV